MVKLGAREKGGQQGGDGAGRNGCGGLFVCEEAGRRMNLHGEDAYHDANRKAGRPILRNHKSSHKKGYLSQCTQPSTVILIQKQTERKRPLLRVDLTVN